MSLLIESIRLHNGQFENLLYHEVRMARALQVLFGITGAVKLEDFLWVRNVPQKVL